MSIESTNAYLERKHDELRLLNSCLRKPLPLASPGSAAEVIRYKFQFTAALKAEHALADWAATETDWAPSSEARSGSFKFSYDYQRADLAVEGPSFYGLDAGTMSETIYTASGMAAISALLLASARVIAKGDMLVFAGSYAETLELIESHARHLRPVTVNRSLEEAIGSTTAFRILLLDSCAPGKAFESTLRCRGPELDLLIFDTTCFSGYSGRVRRVLNWAEQWNIPVVMVRSHTKLDSLGAEYGRLGSANFVRWKRNSCWAARSKLEALPQEARNAVRLLGGAAVPAHFPPYVGAPAYRELTNKRMAAILRNSRRARRYFAAVLADLTEELGYTHGLYLTLSGKDASDEAGARRAAADMSEELGRAGLPIRHAGSFGFDFAATEWFRDATTDRYSVRIAVPDLPTELWNDLTEAIARWWSKHQRKSVA